MYSTEQPVFPASTASVQSILRQHLNEPCPGLEMNGSQSARKDRLYDETSENRLTNNSNRSYFSSSASYADTVEQKNSHSSQAFYQNRASSERHDYFQSHSLNSNQSSRTSAFGNLTRNNQGSTTTSLRNTVACSQQHTFAPQLLPFAYYGNASNFDNFSSYPVVSMHQNQDMPLDYSKSAYHKSTFGGRFAKPGFEMYPSNCFVSPSFAGLTHL